MTYFKLTCRVEINNKLVLKGLHSVEIKKSVFSIADTATLELPTFIKRKEDSFGMEAYPSKREKLSRIISKGMPIKIDLGCNGKNRTEFEGFINLVEEDSVLKLQLIGAAYLLINKNIERKNFKKTTAKDIVLYLLDGTGLSLNDAIPHIEIINFSIKGDINALAVLQELIDSYLLVAYFKGNELRVVLQQQIVMNKVKYLIGSNTLQIDDLKWKESKPIKLRMQLHGTDGSVKYIEVNNGIKAKVVEMKDFGRIVNEEFHRKQLESKLATDEAIGGYVGTFGTLLLPNIETSCKAHILNKNYPSREGIYFVSGVKTTFSTSGAKREIEINGRLS